MAPTVAPVWLLQRCGRKYDIVPSLDYATLSVNLVFFYYIFQPLSHKHKQKSHEADRKVCVGNRIQNVVILTRHKMIISWLNWWISIIAETHTFVKTGVS